MELTLFAKESGALTSQSCSTRCPASRCPTVRNVI